MAKNSEKKSIRASKGKESLRATAGVEQALAAAVRAALSLPGSDEAWDHLEELAERIDRPADTAAAYREALTQQLDREQRQHIGQRALRFFETWYGDDPQVMHELLLPFVDGDAASEWAFERLTRVLSLAETWNDLLDVYDRALARTNDGDRRKKLLDDAAHVAKDFADQSDRAIDYLQQLHLLDRDNSQLSASLERLLERGSRFSDLISLWRSQLGHASGDEARMIRLRIAACHFERLDQPKQALLELRGLLDETPGHADACEQLERMFALARTPLAERLEAFALLRTHYDAARQPEAAIAAIDRAIALSDGAQRRDLLRDAAERLAILKCDVESMAHYGALLVDEPSDADARRQLRRLADRSELHAELARYLIDAAEHATDVAQRTSLLSQAAELRSDALSDPTGAIELLERVLREGELSHRQAVRVAGELAQLFVQTNRPADRLSMLERLAELETRQSTRMVVFSEAAQLAEQLSEIDRALAAWRARLATDPHDLEALNASVRLLTRAERWSELVLVLRERSGCELPRLQQRADLMRIAELCIDYNDELEQGIAALLEVVERFGVDDEVMRRLDAALSRAGRFAELAELLRRGLSEEHPRAASWLARLGDIMRVELDACERAFGLYVQALELDAKLEQAREGLRELANSERYARGAFEALARVHRGVGEWEALILLTKSRVLRATDNAERARILAEAALVLEHELAQPLEALQCACEGFGLDPFQPNLETLVLRLGDLTGRFEPIVAAYARAASANLEHNDVAVRLQYVRARLLETRLCDPQQALSAYVAAFDWITEDRWGERPLDPSPRTLLHAIARCAATLGSWPEATDAVVHATCLLGAEETELLARLESETSSKDQWGAMCDRFALALDSYRDRLSSGLCYRLEIRLALWYLHRNGDLERAEAIALTACKREPSQRDGLMLVCEIQRAHDSIACIDTLLGLFSVDAAQAAIGSSPNLDLLHEAAERAERQSPSRAPEILERLYDEAARLWARGRSAAGERSAAACVDWALARMVKLDLEQGRVERAVQLLLDVAKLPLTPQESWAHRSRAAELLTERGQPERAIAIYQALLEEAPSDLAVLRNLAELLARAGRVPELLATLRRELELSVEPEQQLVLRLRLASLVGEIEQDDGRIVLLKQNLGQEPGHSESLEALFELLLARGRARELAELVTQQAAALEARGELERAGLLWGRVGDLFEHTLDDAREAVIANERSLALVDSPPRVAALAKLYMADGKPAHAAKWLARRLERAEQSERVAILLALGRAQLQAEQAQEAVQTLEIAFSEAPKNAEVRKLLLQQHRAHGAQEALARTLCRAAEHVTDGETVIAYAREAAAIYRRLGCDQELTTAVLQRARSFAPQDRAIGLMLAEAQLATGQLDQAKALLDELIEGFGMRRSAERAAAHFMLARVLSAQNASGAAIDQLDLAHKMDSANVEIVSMLGELAQQTGQLERAERAYRAFLLIVRDESGEQMRARAIGPAEVLMRLSSIAAELGQHEKATERCESALEALVKDDADARRVQAALLARGDLALLKRVLDTRLQHIDNPERRASVLAEYAQLLEDGNADDRSAALERWLQAISSHPAAHHYHEEAARLAGELDQSERYRTLLEQLLERTQTAAQSYARCELLLRLGGLAQAAGELERAAAMYDAAEATSVREVDVWRAQAGCAAALGDNERQIALLRRLATAGEGDGQGEARADALYRLAEVQLAYESTFSDGITALTRALDEDPRFERAGRILERACDSEDPNPDLLSVYERVARASNDGELLLGFLSRQATRSDVLPEEIREGVELALKLEQMEAAERLMLRAVEVAQGLPNGHERVQWALFGLSDRRKAQGDLAGAVKWLLEAIEQTDPVEMLRRSAALVELLSKPDGDLTLAAKLYEHLLDRSPVVRAIWEPLSEIYATLGDLPRLERLVEETLDGIESASDRNLLRHTHARLLVEQGGDLGQASELLREILVDDAKHDGAKELLVEIVARQGTPQELFDLLEQQLSQAQAQGDPAAVAKSALRLGEHLGRTGAHAEELDTYRDALAFAPKNRDLVRRVLGSLGEDDQIERAKLLQSLIETDTPEEAATHALAAAEIHAQREDAAQLLRVLEQGKRRAPSHPALLERLEQAYSDSGDAAGLAQLLSERAAAETDPEREADLLLKAAVLYRDQLSDPALASAMLSRAAEIRPSDLDVARELARLCTMANRPADAVAHLSRGLSHCEDAAIRGELLRLRAEGRLALADEPGALADLEEAFVLDPEAAAPELEAALEERRRAARRSGDTTREQAMTLRLVDVLCVEGKRAQARKALSEWIARAEYDSAALERMLELSEQENDAVGVVDVAARLVYLYDGDLQKNACRRMTEAAFACERVDLARPALEHACLTQPDDRELRTLLKDVYERSNALAELATLLLQDAAQEERAPERVGLLKQAGQHFLAALQTDTAIETLQEARGLDPNDAELLFLLADAYTDAAQLQAADALLDEALPKLEGRRGELALHARRKARLSAQTGDRQKQLGWLVEASKHDKQDGPLQVEVAILAEELQDWDTAERALRTISLMKGESPLPRCELFVRQARIWIVRGDSKRALMFARKAQKEEPDSAQVVVLLQQLGAA